MEHKVRSKLKEIERVFSSSDYSVIDKNTLFLSLYAKDDSVEPQFLEELQRRLSAGESEEEAIRNIVRRDFEEILVLSGSEQLITYYLKQLAKRDLEDDERARIEGNIKRMDAVIQEADRRNRELYQKLSRCENKQSEEYVELLIPKETSVSQVGPSNVTAPILEMGTLCDGLLGQIAHKEEESFGAHVSTTSKIGGGYEGKTVKARLPSYGNPHGLKVNRVYGQLLRKDKKTRIYGEDGTPNSCFIEGNAHQCVYLGIPSTEITAICIKNVEDLETQKKAVATKGFFIPVVSEHTGELLFTPEEFDEMKIFYHGLSKKGYSETIIDNVYQYYKKMSSSEEVDPKNKLIFLVAVQYCKQNPNQTAVDLAILADYLRNDVLNKFFLERYGKEVEKLAETGDFDEFMKFIKSIVNIQRVKGGMHDFFEERDPEAKHRSIKSSAFKNFEEQMSVAGISPESQEYKEMKRNVLRIIFAKKLTPENIVEIQNELVAIRKKILADAWEKATRKVENYEKWKSRICPVFVGSLGTMESGFASDNDFMVFTDDLNEDGTELGESQRQELNSVCAQVVEQMKNNWNPRMGDFDAGKFNAGGDAVVSTSEIKKFQVNFNNLGSFQKIEPTAMINANSFFPEDEQQKALRKKALQLFMENPSSVYYDSVARYALELKSAHGTSETPAFVHKFNEIYESLGSGEILDNIKISLQRTINFKLYHLLFRACQTEQIPQEEWGKIPARIVGEGGKIDLLKKYGILTDKEASIITELSTSTYRLRCIGELLAEKEGKSINISHSFITYDDRERLMHLMRDFKEYVLYK